MFKASFFILNSPPFYPIRQMKPLDFHHGYAPITHPSKKAFAQREIHLAK